MYNFKQLRVFSCKTCKKTYELMSELDEDPKKDCSSCQNLSKFKEMLVEELDGAPAGYVKGTQNPCKNKNPTVLKKKKKVL